MYYLTAFHTNHLRHQLLFGFFYKIQIYNSRLKYSPPIRLLKENGFMVIFTKNNANFVYYYVRFRKCYLWPLS